MVILSIQTDKGTLGWKKISVQFCLHTTLNVRSVYRTISGGS